MTPTLITSKWACPKCGKVETQRTHIKPETVYHTNCPKATKGHYPRMKEVVAK